MSEFDHRPASTVLKTSVWSTSTSRKPQFFSKNYIVLTQCWKLCYYKLAPTGVMFANKTVKSTSLIIGQKSWKTMRLSKHQRVKPQIWSASSLKLEKHQLNLANWTNVFWSTGWYFGVIIKYNFGALVSVLMNSPLFYQTESCGIGILTFARAAVKISLVVSLAEFEP